MLVSPLVHFSAEAMPDTTISHYRVLHRLGAGGMGEVYAGVDETLKRRVALKAIRAEYRLNAQAKARFLREARILSQLDHPNVCRVYDYIEGEDSDWLVLELIDGKSLRVAIKDGLEPALKMRIAEQIAAVLVATHTAGVVHRDLKPGNVMLTAGREVKVLDFGLAWSGRDRDEPAEPATPGAEPPVPSADAGDDSSPTRSSPWPRPDPIAAGSSREELSRFETERGLVMGTLAYMSPEQARGEPATAASDMYSFGLLLQELFTGRGSYPRDLDPEAFADRVRTGETLPPVGLGADLAGLIARLKSPPPAQRPTAVEASSRLRWIREKPRRRLRNLALAAALTAVGLGALKYTMDLARERTAAVAARVEADRRREQAEDLIGFMLGDLRKKLEPVGRLEILDEVGAKAMDYFASVPDSSLSDKELLRRSTALYQIGTVRMAQGKLEAATRPLQESLTLAAALVERSPDDGERLYGLGQSEFWVGFAYWRRRNLDAALEHFRKYLDISEKLARMAPANADWQQELASAHSNLGSVLQERGDLDGALDKFRAALAIESSLLEQEPEDPTRLRAVAASHNAVGVVLRAQGRLAEALGEHRAELAIQETLVRAHPEDATWRLYLGVAHNYVGIVLEAQGWLDDAREHFQTAVSACDALVARDPTNMNWRREFGRNHFRLGRLLLRQAAPDAAFEHLRRAAEVLGQLAAGDPSNSGWQRDAAEAHHALGEVLRARGDLDAAAREAQAALSIAEGLRQESDQDRQASRLESLSHALLAEVRARRGDTKGAREAWVRALAAIEPVAQASRDDRFLEPWARALLGLGRVDEAQAVLDGLRAIGYRDPILSKAVASRGLRLPPANVTHDKEE